MIFKGQFCPSYLLCPETYTWHRIENCLELLNKQKYNRLNADLNAKDTDEFDGDLNDIRIRKGSDSSSSQVISFKEFLKYIRRDYVNEIKFLMNGYCKLFGKQLLKNIYIKF